MRIPRKPPRKPPKKLKPGQAATYAANPYYDEVLAFPELQVPTSQDFYKLVDPVKGLYERKRKENVVDFDAHLKERLLKRKKPWWPHSEKLSMVVSISGPKSYIELKDLDNFLKTIFDAIKGVVIMDDHQIVSVTVEKNEIPFVSGLLISIRRETKDAEYIFGQNPGTWEEDRKLKVAQGGICCMDMY